MKNMRKNTKRAAAAGLAIILALSLGACGGKKGSAEEAYGETFAELAAFTRNGSSGNSGENGAVSARAASSGTASIGKTETGDALRDWWNGDWYGWWKMSSCTGYYEESEGHWWDICAAIDVGADHVGTIELWDEDYSRNDSMITAAVSLNEAGTGEHGTMYSEGGWFTDMELAHADWIVDPGLLKYDNMIMIDGWYENGDDSYKYEIYLRPWGLLWDDLSAEELPYYYQSWYVPLVEAGKTMPDSIDPEAVSTSAAGETQAGGATQATTGSAASTDVPKGDGLVTEEQVLKGYVWMESVAKDIFNTTYEELAAYFGVDGEFDKEEYSDHMKMNYRYYKWVSSENPMHYIYVNFAEKEAGVYKVSAYHTNGFSGSEASEKYLDIVKAEAAEADKAASANAEMKAFSVEIQDFYEKKSVKIMTSIPTNGWSYDKDQKMLVENDDPNAFGAGMIRFELKDKVDDFDFYKDSFENYQEIEDRVIGGITFKGRTYKRIGYPWIEYVAQIDDERALSVALLKMDCVPGTMPDIILNNMTFQ